MPDRRRGASPGTAGAAVLVVAGLALGGCTADPAPDGAAAGPTAVVAADAEPAAYDQGAAGAAASGDRVLLDQLLRGFSAPDARGGVVADTAFGTAEQVSGAADGEPLVVRYRVSDDAVWSDGEPVDCDDLLLAWAVGAGLLGTPAASGYEDASAPACAAGEREATVAFSTPYADWRLLFGARSVLPAHVLARSAGVDDLVGLLTAATPAAEQGGAAAPPDDLARLGQARTALWTGGAASFDPATWLSSGPFRIDSWEAGRQVVLVPNERWWGGAPQLGRLVVRVVDAAAQAQALADGEVQVVRPAPAADVLAQLRALGDDVVVETGAQSTSEHLDLSLSGLFADPSLRRALALCLPREQLVEELVRPVDPGAQVLQATRRLPFQEGYDALVASAHPGGHDQPDLAAARQLVEAAGATGAVVRIGYRAPDARRAQEVALVRDSCAQVGLDVQDAGREDFLAEGTGGLADGGVEAALVSRSASPGVVSGASAWVTGGAANRTGYSSPEVDRLTAQLVVETDPAEQQRLLAQVEARLWADLPTVPLFALPGVQAHAAGLVGPAYQPSPAGQAWNAQDWRREAS